MPVVPTFVFVLCLPPLNTACLRSNYNDVTAWSFDLAALYQCRRNSQWPDSTDIDLLDLFLEVHLLNGFLFFCEVTSIVDHYIDLILPNMVQKLLNLSRIGNIHALYDRNFTLYLPQAPSGPPRRPDDFGTLCRSHSCQLQA